jgi:pimeloyl-ACP methyl ester carboxylesterase
LNRPIVFLHGFPFNSQLWKPQIEYFGRSFRVLAPDLRGHGKNPMTEDPGPWLMGHYVNDLKLLLDREGVRSVFLCGVSMGGYIALEFVARYPERVSGLILSDTRADADSNEAKQKRYELIERIYSEGMGGFASEFSRKVVSESTLRNRPYVQRELEAMILGNTSRNVAMTLGMMASRPTNVPNLSRIQCPTLVCAGVDDSITPQAVNEFIAGGIEGARFRLIHEAGHLPNIEQPAVFNSYVDEFIRTTFDRRPLPLIG